MKNYIKQILLCTLLSAVILIGGCTHISEPLPITDTKGTTAENINDTSPSDFTAGTDETEAAFSQSTEETATTPAEEPPADRALQLLSQMSLEEKIGQVILCRYPDDAQELQEKYYFGGYTLYAKDFRNETEESIKEKLKEISDASPIPPFIAADEEGGSVVRISGYPQFSDYPLPPLSEGAKDPAHFAEKWRRC
ncbi:MAG: hypothetical protein HDT44_00685 [Ruminococcaceae bacterium]|nr:hypothetical protein [Oscillospiraceae bacterium]